MRNSAERCAEAHQLVLELGVTSQWLAAGPMRSAFCIAIGQPTTANWTVEGLLPNGEIVPLADYPMNGDPLMDPPPESTLFHPNQPRYISINAMCGLPLRFVASPSQDPSAQFWVVFKS